MEELGSDGFLSKEFTDPNRGQVINTEPPATEPSAQVTEPPVQTPVAEQAPPAQSTPKPDEFFDNLNKRYNTSFKEDGELKNIFELPKKVTEYEGRLKEADNWKKQNDEYQKQIEELRNAGNSELLSKPLLRSAYVAQQLLDKFPDKDPFVLQEIAMTDISKLGDLDALVKEQKMDLPTLSEADIRAALLDKYGIDPDTKPEEWSSIAKTKLAIDAKGARANIKALTSGIELPKAVTREEREKVEQENLQKKIQLSEPLKADFTQFDEFKSEDFKFDVNADYKSKLPDMFDAMFIQAGMEPSKENLDIAKEMRDGQFLLQNFPKIREVIAKQAQVELQKKIDEELSNNKQPNTTTATDDNANREELPGPSLSSAFANNRL